MKTSQKKSDFHFGIFGKHHKKDELFAKNYVDSINRASIKSTLGKNINKHNKSRTGKKVQITNIRIILKSQFSYKKLYTKLKIKSKSVKIKKK